MRSTVGLWYADRRVNVPNRKVSPVSPDHPGWALIRSHPGIILGLALGDPEKPEKPSGWWLPDKLSGGEDRLDPLRCAARVSRVGGEFTPVPSRTPVVSPYPHHWYLLGTRYKGIKLKYGVMYRAPFARWQSQTPTMQQSLEATKNYKYHPITTTDSTDMQSCHLTRLFLTSDFLKANTHVRYARPLSARQSVAVLFFLLARHNTNVTPSSTQTQQQTRSSRLSRWHIS